MNENNKETFQTTLTNENQVLSLDFNDDEMDIDIKSSTGSKDTLRANAEVEEVINNQESQELSSTLIPRVESIDGIENNRPTHDPSTSVIDEQVQVVIPKSVYDYAATINQTLESPRQNKLDHDVTAILGSSDPPAGFGFLHPRFYYLEQKRPLPLKPLQVWRGYNGHVYFSPIQVQQLESDRVTSPTKSLKSTGTRSVSSIRKSITERPDTILSSYKNRRSITPKTNHFKEPINNERSSTKKQPQIGTTINAKITSSNNEFKNPTSVTFIDEEDHTQESAKMWQSVVTCAHVQIKPISKRSQNAIEDLQTLQQEQSSQDPTGYNRQVLPNIRRVPKSKFIYKGLAYKESQKLPGIANGNDTDGNALQKPLVAYNLAQTYARYEINAARAKQNLQQPPPPTPAPITGTISKDPSSPVQTSLDLREMRRRIIRGTTLAYRPPPQSVSWTPGRADHRSALGSEVLLPIQRLNTVNHAPISLVFPLYQQQHITVHTTPNLSQIFEIPTADNYTNISSL